MLAERLTAIREFIRRRAVLARRSAGSGVRGLVKHRAEVTLALAVLIGWASLTAGVCTLCSPARGRAIWPISIGLLLLSCCGWGFLARTAIAGLYVTTRKAPGA